jgi:hypothetical protein
MSTPIFRELVSFHEASTFPDGWSKYGEVTSQFSQNCLRGENDYLTMLQSGPTNWKYDERHNDQRREKQKGFTEV